MLLGYLLKAICCTSTNERVSRMDWYGREYWANGSDHGDRDFLLNLTSWQFSVNDVDFCTGPGNETLFIYGMCAQVGARVGDIIVPVK